MFQKSPVSLQVINGADYCTLVLQPTDPEIRSPQMKNPLIQDTPFEEMKMQTISDRYE